MCFMHCGMFVCGGMAFIGCWGNVCLIHLILITEGIPPIALVNFQTHKLQNVLKVSKQHILHFLFYENGNLFLCLLLASHILLILHAILGKSFGAALDTRRNEKGNMT